MADMYRLDPPLPEDAAYHVIRTCALPATLLLGHDPAWRTASTIAWGPAPYRTSFAALWNDDGLAVRFVVCDPDPWHTMTRRDDQIWDEEVVELFVDPTRTGRHYAEVEFSPINVVTDLHIHEPAPHLTGDRAWDWFGLESTVTPWSSSGLDPGGWMVLAWLPWPGLQHLTADVAALVPPAPDDRWRFNVFRIKRPYGPAEPERGVIYAAWSVPGGHSFHEPASFRDMVFGSERVANT
jgi:hypothetical protein